VKSLHDEANEEEQFEESERLVIFLVCSWTMQYICFSYTSQQNQRISQFLLTQVKGKFSTVYSPRTMRRKSVDDISFGSVSTLAMCCVCNFRAVKMFHLLAASRQDVPSFGGGSCGMLC
jgi:hypothetical protein